MEYLGKTNKKVIIIIMLFAFLIIIGIIYFMLLQKDTQTSENSISTNSTEIVGSSEQEFKEIQSYDIYYSVKGILNNYITMIREANGDEYIQFDRLQMSRDEAIETLVNQSIDSLYNMLDENFIKECNITKESLNNLAQNYRQQGDYSRNVVYDLTIDEMYVADISTEINFIFLKFKINQIEDKMLIKLDLQNDTYSMFGQEYLDSKNYDENTKVSEIEIDTNSIASNNYNSFDFVNTDDKYVINQYFSEYQNKLLNNVDSAYELLNEEYREKKYGDFQEFRTYVEENYEELRNNSLTQYLINQFDEYKEYVCIDANNHYYIFIEKSITDYDVILDTYTIDLKDFTDKYDVADVPNKVGMNIEKVINAINDGDYKYVYNKLDETFKNNNFGNLDNFTTYINENFYNNNEIEYLEFSAEGDTYIYEARIKNTEENVEKKDFTIIMKLLEGTNFVMSFSIG